MYKPDVIGERQGLPAKRYPLKRFKVIRIYYAWTRSKQDALKYAIEGAIDPDVEFAVEEQPKGWMGNLVKQLLG